MVSCIYVNVPRNAIVRLHRPRSRDKRGHKTFLAPSVDKKTRNYDTECSSHHPDQSPNLIDNQTLYDYQILHHNLCFNLFLLHNSFDNQGNEIIFSRFFSSFHVSTYCLLRKLSSRIFIHEALYMKRFSWILMCNTSKYKMNIHCEREWFE